MHQHFLNLRHINIKKENGSLWYKSYVNIENLSLTQGLKVGNFTPENLGAYMQLSNICIIE